MYESSITSCDIRWNYDKTIPGILHLSKSKMISTRFLGKMGGKRSEPGGVWSQKVREKNSKQGVGVPRFESKYWNRKTSKQNSKERIEIGRSVRKKNRKENTEMNSLKNPKSHTGRRAVDNDQHGVAIRLAIILASFTETASGLASRKINVFAVAGEIAEWFIWPLN